MRTARIGVDVGHSGVRAVQIMHSRNVCSADGVAVCDGDVRFDADEPGNLAERLRECFAQSSFRGKRCSLSLNSPDIEFHPLELPAELQDGPVGNLANVVRCEIERLATGRRNDLQTEFWKLPCGNSNTPNIMGVSADRAVILSRIQSCQLAGVRCRRIDAAALALIRFVLSLRKFEPDEVWSVMDVGHSGSRLTVCVDHVPVLARHVGAGSNSWTVRLAETLGISEKSAETQKREHGIAPPRRGANNEPGAPEGDEIASLILNAIRGDLTELAGEIKRSYEYVMSSYSAKRASDLILTGGGAALRCLPEFLNELLGIPVRRASDYLDEASCGFKCPDELRPQIDVLAGAIGLSLEPAT